MVAKPSTTKENAPNDSHLFINREMSWLAFAARVLALAQDPDLPLLERVKFVGIMGMLHDEFFMKRIGGLKRQIRAARAKLSLDGRTPREEFDACREEIGRQVTELERLLREEIRPGLAVAGIPIREYAELDADEQAALRRSFVDQVLPVLTPLAVDAEHPFPFISNLGLNLAVQLGPKRSERFVRIKVPPNRPRWVPLAAGFVPLEQVIAANLDLVFPEERLAGYWMFRVTRGVESDAEGEPTDDPDRPHPPGSIVTQVAEELKARRFAGVVRLEVSPDMPEIMQTWLVQQLSAWPEDVYRTEGLVGFADLTRLAVDDRDELRQAPHRPVTHPRLRAVGEGGPDALFAEITRGDILLHHPYHDFDSSVFRFIQCAETDPRVVAVKLTIYRTSADSPIVRTLTEAARAGKQVAVAVEVTARFDEAPNIAWGRMLETAGAHVAYGIEKLKTHVKLALIVREEAEGLRRYVHIGTGNYHSGTARLYEDIGLLSCDQGLAEEVSAVFNELTGATRHPGYRTLVVAPHVMRARFVELIRREVEHAAAGRKSGIYAKMNQLQDAELIRELIRASQAGVPIRLNVRGLCCLRPGVAGASEKVRVYSVVGRFLEHARVYRFENGGEPELFIGSADWMKRNLDHRLETVAPVRDPALRRQLEAIIAVYESDNCSAWDLQPDGTYVRRTPAKGEAPRAAQSVFVDQARSS
jgi:polyphosphate kinase